MKRKIGFLGGTFDPIHFGHINLALELKEKWGLDAVLFCPANKNPFKDGSIAGIEDRVAMCALAIEDIPEAHLLDIEAKRQGPSYTIDTLQELSKQEEADYFLLLSEETASEFASWKRVDDILKLATPLVGSRIGAPKDMILKGPSHIVEALLRGRTEIRNLEISSTLLRERLSHDLYCGHLLPKKVLDYIKDLRLYSFGHER